MLLPLLPDLAAQMGQLTRNTMDPRANFSFPLPIPAFVNITSEHHPVSSSSPSPNPSFPTIWKPLFYQCLNLYQKTNLSTDLNHYLLLVSVSISHIYLTLVLNTITQLVRVAGVHRLTTRVRALTVTGTLVLIIHKARKLRSLDPGNLFLQQFPSPFYDDPK